MVVIVLCKTLVFLTKTLKCYIIRSILLCILVFRLIDSSRKEILISIPDTSSAYTLKILKEK